MEDIRPLTEQLAVTDQLQANELAAVAAAGFRSVINNRPDGEAPDQPAAAQLAHAAAAAGLEYRHLPVVSGQVSDAEAVAFAALLAELPQPVLAFCRTGTRSAVLWALGAARRQTPAQILAICGQAGYDLQGIAPRLQALHRPQDQAASAQR